MLYSLIIPTFNAAATIRRALDSVFRQKSGAAFEVIVVDDCSTDDTASIVRDYAQAHGNLRIGQCARNGGPGVARNLGVDMAAGEWIGFIDADDELEDSFFAELNIATDTAPSADLIAFDWRFANSPIPDGARNDLGRLAAGNPDERVSDYLLNRVDCSVIFHLFRAKFLQDNGIEFRGGFHEDVDFMFHAFLRAREMRCVNAVLYRKQDTAGSITNTLGLQHIDGYFDSLEAMQRLLEKDTLADKFKDAFVAGVVNVTSSRLMRLLEAKIVKKEQVDAIASRLYARARGLFETLGVPLSRFKPGSSFRTKYRIMFETFADLMQRETGAAELIPALEGVRNKSWSCYDLHNSVFLAPGEIRTCCKRFFAEGKLKGDVVLMRGSEKEFTFSYEDIEREKTKLHTEINRDNAPECKGCPFLKFEEWGKPLAKGFKYISLEYHSVCNMRCTYCSDTYYGGKKAAYDVVNVIETARAAGSLAQCEYVVWGGGEPTVDPAFATIAPMLSEAVPNVRQRVITNGTIYTDVLADLLQRERAFIVTSIDAGTEKTFREIRKYKHFKRVLGNLRRYSESAAHNIILKYILLPENSSNGELEAFVELMTEYDLLRCNFQISCDFKTPAMNKEQIGAIATLYSLLQERNANFVFTDDLVWQRLPRMSQEMVGNVIEHMKEPSRSVVEPARDHDVVVWGTGAQAQILMEKSHFLRNTKVSYFVDPRVDMIGKKFRGLPIRAPSALLQDDAPVVIAAVQSAPFIYQEIKAMNLDGRRVVNGLIL